MKAYISEENVKEMVKRSVTIILENREGKNINLARRYLLSKGMDINQAQETLDAIRHDVTNARLAQGKFLLGIARMTYEGQLKQGKDIFDLNRILNYITIKPHVDEYDNNLNGENLETLVNRFAVVAKTDLAKSKAESEGRTLSKNKLYDVVPIETFEEASKYSRYTSWCITHGESNYDSCSNQGLCKFYFCLKKGFEKIPKVRGEGCPLDEYGLSMIAISVEEDGALHSSTCRWNHDNSGNDHILSVKQIEDILGLNFYEVFKPYSEEELKEKSGCEPILENGKVVGINFFKIKKQVLLKDIRVDMTWDEAMKYAESIGKVLPRLNELKEMYKGKRYFEDIVSKGQYGKYWVLWSSSQCSAYLAWAMGTLVLTTTFPKFNGFAVVPCADLNT